MSIDKSLKKKSGLARARNVLKRGERITMLKDQDRWTDEAGPYALPKVRVFRMIAKKAKKKKEEEGAEGAAAGTGAAATPAAAADAGKGAKAPAAAAAKPAGKADAGKKK